MSLPQVVNVVGEVANANPQGKVAALRCVAMNTQRCALTPVVIPDPLGNPNTWNAVFTLTETQAIDGIILPNFNQTNLLVVPTIVILQTANLTSGIPPSTNLAPLINRDYWNSSAVSNTSSTGLDSLYNYYQFTPSDYDDLDGMSGYPKLAVVTVTFTGSGAF
jgi:hypothetical protein